MMMTNDRRQYKDNISRRIGVYKKSAEQQFSFLKNTDKLDDLFAKSIKIDEDTCYLIPLCLVHKADDVLISILKTLHRENYITYPKRLPVTTKGIINWMDELTAARDKILFLVLDRHGKPVGHIGLLNQATDICRCKVIDIAWNKNENYTETVSLCMKALLNWVEETIFPEEIFLQAFLNDQSAIDFYESAGFVQDNKSLHKSDDCVKSLSQSSKSQDIASARDMLLATMVFRPNRNPGKKLILTAGPSICAKEASYALDAARFGWNHRFADYIKKFESSFAEYLGVKHALCFSSCTGCLHLSLLSLGIGPDDEVIVPDITWVATANAVLYTGATPVFADIDPQTWCISPASIRACITARTKVIIPVHLYGHPAPMDEIVEIAKKNRLFIVEDAAPAIGAEYKGRKTGTFGDFAAFSFQGAKLVVAGEGGMLVTNNDKLYQKVYSLWDQGRRPGTFWIQDNGWKYKMSNIQAAIGLGQFERIDELIEAKRRIFRWYEDGLKDVQGLSLCYEPEGTRSIYWMSSILIDKNSPIGRDQLRDELLKHNIDTRNVFPAISQYPIWPKKQSPQPIAKLVGDQAINLPSGVCLSDEEVAYICNCIREILHSQPHRF